MVDFPDSPEPATSQDRVGSEKVCPVGYDTRGTILTEEEDLAFLAIPPRVLLDLTVYLRRTFALFSGRGSEGRRG
jgi:hypothetical protein